MTDRILILDPQLKSSLGEIPSFIYLDPIEFFLGCRDFETIQKIDFDEDKIRDQLKSYNSAMIRWQNDFASYYYFEFYAIECIKYLCSFLKKNYIKKCLFYTGSPHHFDSIFWSIACDISGVRQYFLVPNSTSQGHVLVEQRGDIHTRKLVNINKQVDRLIIDEIEKSLNNLSKFSAPVSAATISRKSQSYIYALYYLMMTYLKQSLLPSRLTKVNRILSFGTFNTSIWFDLAQINRQRKYLNLYDSQSYSGDIEDNSIIYFAHYQPEANIDPEVGKFANQLSNLDKLCKLYPNKKIYYKEHPGTWCYTLNRTGLTKVGLTRDLEYFKFLEKRVTFLDRNYYISDTVQKNRSIMFVSINGTIGLQRALQGLRTYFFHHAWFSDFFKSSIKKLSSDSSDNNFIDEKDTDIKTLAHEISQSSLQIGTSIGLDRIDGTNMFESDVILLREFLLTSGE